MGVSYRWKMANALPFIAKGKAVLAIYVAAKDTSTALHY